MNKIAISLFSLLLLSTPFAGSAAQNSEMPTSENPNDTRAVPNGTSVQSSREAPTIYYGKPYSYAPHYSYYPPRPYRYPPYAYYHQGPIHHFPYRPYYYHYGW